MIIVKRISLWLALGGLVLTVWTLATAQQKQPMPQPVERPPTSPYASTVAASGIIEAVNENVRVSPPLGGLVMEVFVTVGDVVTSGDALLRLDDRDLRAQLVAREAAIAPARARLGEQEMRVKDLQVQYRRLRSVQDQRAVSDDEVKRTWYALEVAKRGLVRAHAELRQARAQREETTMLIDRLVVRAPRNGTVLQVNTRAGEFVEPGQSEPAILLGLTEQLQVRADVDEVNALLVAPGSPGVAFVRGYAEQAIPLTFQRIEPFIVPKRSLTGDNTERVDTRVLQVIYRFTPPAFPVYAGQQVDVFIERRDGAARRPARLREP